MRSTLPCILRKLLPTAQRQRCIRIKVRSSRKRKKEEPSLDEDIDSLAPVLVLLMFGETMKLYQQDFERWLSIKKVAIESLDSDPAVNHRLRFDELYNK